MLRYLKFFIPIIQIIYSHNSIDNQQTPNDQSGNLRIFIGTEKNYVFISDENHLKIKKLCDPCHLENFKFYYISHKNIENFEERQRFEKFINDIKSSNISNWEQYKNNIEKDYEKNTCTQFYFEILVIFSKTF